MHFDGSTPPVPNYYEAACYFNNKYYALGVGGALDTPKKVVNQAFGANIHWGYCSANIYDQKCGISPWVEVP